MLVDQWRLLPVVGNGDFFLWLIAGFYPEKWLLLLVFRLMATSASGLINGDFCQNVD